MREVDVYRVPADLGGERLDVALARLAGISRSKAAALVDTAAVTVDGSRPTRSLHVSTGSRIEVGMEAARIEEPLSRPAVTVPVLFEDDHLVVIDKPAGAAVHASPGWDGPTVVDSLRVAGVVLTEAGPAERGGVVQRLDVGTTGLMVLAKSHLAYRDLKRQFRDRDVTKIYHALVQGHPDPLEGTVDAPIGRHPRQDHKFAVVSGGRNAVTHYRTLEAFRRASLLEVNLETGRTHQIRVHMAAVRHPCCGDLTYGADPTLARELGLDRQWLHSVELVIDHPSSGRRLRFASEYPDDLQRALSRCRGW